MTINFSVSGNDRKRLVQHISQIKEVPAKYLGVPSCAYQVENITISRDGELTFHGDFDSGEIEMLIERLSELGFEAEIPTEEGKLIIQMPRASFTDVALENLKKLIEARGSLIKKALDVNALPIEMDEDRISFPWFTNKLNGDEVKTYTHFITALCEMAKTQQRVNVTEKQVENEKYAFRCFLIRLGFIGSEHKAERKLLLKNLSGNSAFKNGVPSKDEEVMVDE